MSDLLALADLLQGGTQGHDAPGGGSSTVSTSTVVTPASFGAAASRERTSSKGSDPKAIWTADEVEYEDRIVSPPDSRPTPEYRMYYKQDVDAGDVYLGMGDKTPGSQDCSHVVYRIAFPGASRSSELELDVQRRRIVAESVDLRLDTFLPVVVDAENGAAKWDAAKHTLTVTLPIVWEEA